MKTLSSSLTLALVFSVNACSLNGFAERPDASLYCDKFLICDLCAQDLNRDGVVEYVYFPDSLDVFMYREGAESNIPRNLAMHRCALLMDEDLVATTSRVFYMDEATTFLEKQDIRGAMMIKYIAYIPEVAACNLRAEQAVATGDADS